MAHVSVALEVPSSTHKSGGQGAILFVMRDTPTQ